MLFVRHANANPLQGPARLNEDGTVVHDWKFRDQTRALSNKGLDQCEQSKHLLEGFNIKANLTSPARRATDTAVRMTMSIAAAQEEKGHEIFLRLVESLHPAGMSMTCENLFDSLGYGPLRSFCDAKDGKDAFVDYGNRVCQELAAKTGGPAMSAVEHGDTFAIYGHAVFLNAICYCIATEAAMPEVDFLLDVDLGEAQVIFMDLKAKTIKHLK